MKRSNTSFTIFKQSLSLETLIVLWFPLKYWKLHCISQTFLLKADYLRPKIG